MVDKIILTTRAEEANEELFRLIIKWIVAPAFLTILVALPVNYLGFSFKNSLIIGLIIVIIGFVLIKFRKKIFGKR